MIYAIIIGLLLLLIVRFDIKGKANVKASKAWKVWYYIVLIIMIALPVLSYEMGSDIQRYAEQYEYNVKPIYIFTFEDFRYEPIFCIMESLFKTIGLKWFVVYAIIIGFVNSAIFIFGKRYVKNFFLFVLLYFLLHFYEMNFEPIRQSIAMGIFLLSIHHLEENKKVKYLVCILVAIGFHISSVFALILPFVKGVRFNRWSYLAIFFVFVIGNIVNRHFSDVVMLTSLIGSEEYYGQYLQSDFVNHQLNVNGIIKLVAVKILPVIVSVKMIRKKKSIFFPHLEAVAFMLVIFMALRAAVPLFDRFVLYWGIIQVAVIAEAMYITKIPRMDQATTIVLRMYIIMAFALNTITYYNGSNIYGFKNYRRFYPYNSIMEKNVDMERRNNQLFIRR